MSEPSDRERHWDTAYETRGVEGVSWFQPEPQVSLELIFALGVGTDQSVIDVGGGASLLADHLVHGGWRDVSVVDVSGAALDAARSRNEADAPIHWVHRDILGWNPERRYGLWHDRAVFHFLNERTEQHAYMETLRAALAPGGAVILATFALDGPESCSGLPVSRYSSDDLSTLLGADFEVVKTRREVHSTPSGGRQPFSWVAARDLRRELGSSVTPQLITRGSTRAPQNRAEE